MCKIEDGVYKRNLDSWEDFVEFIRIEHRQFPACIYRGQPDADWLVESTLDRLEKRSPMKFIHGLNQGDEDQETTVPPAFDEQQLSAFRTAARGRLLEGESLPDDLELWAIGRHHGLAAPLLDFTASPLVALYFAFEDKYCYDKNGNAYEPTNRAVFGVPVHIDKMIEYEYKEKKEMKAAEVKAFTTSRVGSHRLISQAGIFLEIPRHRDLEAFVRETFAGESTVHGSYARKILSSISMPNIDRIDCLKFLSKMNINRMSLFPDLDGAAAHINNLWEQNFDTVLDYLVKPVEKKRSD